MAKKQKKRRGGGEEYSVEPLQQGIEDHQAQSLNYCHYKRGMKMAEWKVTGGLAIMVFIVTEKTYTALTFTKSTYQP
ncbi:hypothetical protein XELAEV_18035037mg [Xenopus laevis]|uniref:Uncharacterized protein n=1 Tax=Xenopus laevis TaxID=8355 RepID=A0A974CG92_XENLA|nr:hypothetical protein XELAEV_18035037mg [Xenopus laevis]